MQSITPNNIDKTYKKALKAVKKRVSDLELKHVDLTLCHIKNDEHNCVDMPRTHNGAYWKISNYTPVTMNFTPFLSHKALSPKVSVWLQSIILAIPYMLPAMCAHHMISYGYEHSHYEEFTYFCDKSHVAQSVKTYNDCFDENERIFETEDTILAFIEKHAFYIKQQSMENIKETAHNKRKHFTQKERMQNDFIVVDALFQKICNIEKAFRVFYDNCDFGQEEECGQLDNMIYVHGGYMDEESIIQEYDQFTDGLGEENSTVFCFGKTSLSESLKGFQQLEKLITEVDALTCHPLLSA